MPVTIISGVSKYTRFFKGFSDTLLFILSCVLSLCLYDVSIAFCSAKLRKKSKLTHNYWSLDIVLLTKAINNGFGLRTVPVYSG